MKTEPIKWKITPTTLLRLSSRLQEAQKSGPDGGTASAPASQTQRSRIAIASVKPARKRGAGRLSMLFLTSPSVLCGEGCVRETQISLIWKVSEGQSGSRGLLRRE